MSIRGMLPSNSKYLRATDFPEGAEMALVADRIEEEEFEDSESTKPVLYFDGKEKGLVLNQTNLAIVSEVANDDPAQVPGQQLVLYRTTATLRGKTVPALRLRIPTTTVQSEDIPF